MYALELIAQTHSHTHSTFTRTRAQTLHFSQNKVFYNFNFKCLYISASFAPRGLRQISFDWKFYLVTHGMCNAILTKLNQHYILFNLYFWRWRLSSKNYQQWARLPNIARKTYTLYTRLFLDLMILVINTNVYSLLLLVINSSQCMYTWTVMIVVNPKNKI